MADLILIPESDKISATDINKALINLSKRIDAAMQIPPSQVTVDGVVKTLKWKVITPATPGAPADTGSSGSFFVNHGVSNILFAIVNISAYIFQQSSGQFYTEWNSVQVGANAINAAYYNLPYIITISYWE
jgi:hypothetical protein